MFCTNCGKTIPINSAFCIDCGRPVSQEEVKTSSTTGLGKKWWFRLAIVIYIGLYVPLPFAVIGVWVANAPGSYYDYYSKTWQHYGSYGEAFWYSLLTIVIWIVVLRLVKIIFLYIAFAQRPQWKREFKKLY